MTSNSKESIKVIEEKYELILKQHSIEKKELESRLKDSTLSSVKLKDKLANLEQQLNDYEALKLEFVNVLVLIRLKKILKRIETKES